MGNRHDKSDRHGYRDDGRLTYAEQHRDGYAYWLGMLTDSDGSKQYAEHGADGQYDGRRLRNASGTTSYWLYERCKRKEYAFVSADGGFMYNGVRCAPDDPRLLALIAQVAPVEVRPAAAVPHRPLGPGNRAPARFAPQALATAVDTEVHPHAARCRWWPCGTTQQSIALQSTTTQWRVHGPICRPGRTGGANACTLLQP